MTTLAQPDATEGGTFLVDGRHTGWFGGYSIGSAFQPIFSLAHRRAVGFEGLLRAREGAGAPVPPEQVFRSSGSEGERVRLDRLCRTVHVRNFLADRGEGWLFLNVDPRVCVRGWHYGPFFGGMLEQCGLPPHRVVVEILEGEIQDEGVLAEAVAYYRELGCLVAIDDFGAGHSNLERVARIRPEIVKLDRSLIAQAADDTPVRRLLPGLVGLIQEAGGFALVEGVETEEQALIAIDAGIDFVQGYYLARPAARATAPRAVVPHLCDRFLHVANAGAGRCREELQHYQRAFTAAADALATAQPTRECCRSLLELPRIERCYMLDMSGRQCSAELQSERRARQPDARFAPLLDTGEAVWSCRPHFRRAAATPGRVQTSRPYRSVRGNNACITLAVRLDGLTEPRIFCADLDWSECAA
ncbi:MAG: EAL domain-containing protein [Betaproteobacteria bacterium]|nr:EAL domain-containing protein [Betaproteobacteria bacterium]